MKQFLILYRRAGAASWGRLTPGIHENLYKIPPVDAAIAALRANPTFEAVAVRVENEQFNIMVFDQEALAPDAIELG